MKNYLKEFFEDFSPGELNRAQQFLMEISPRRVIMNYASNAPLVKVAADDVADGLRERGVRPMCDWGEYDSPEDLLIPDEWP